MALTATDFRTPLLLALGTLTNHTPETSVSVTDVYDTIIKTMGIPSLDAHGVNISGKPQVAQWIQWAYKDVRKAQLASNPEGTRGKWTLTAAGVQEAIRLAKGIGGTMPTSAPPVVAGSAPPVAPNPLLGASLYHSDAYLRSLAINETGCFGNRSPHGAAACATCPLAVACRHKQLALFSDLAGLLKNEDSQAENRKKLKDTTPGKVDAKAASTSNRFADINFKDVDIIVNKAESICIACGQTISKEERCRWVEELPSEDDGALFHLDCSGGE